jgi:hypothetical protein
MNHTEIIEWLLEGDVAIRYQSSWHCPSDLQARIHRGLGETVAIQMEIGALTSTAQNGPPPFS